MVLQIAKELTARDLQPESLEELAAVGAEALHSSQKVADNSEVIITLLPDCPGAEPLALAEDSGGGSDGYGTSACAAPIRVSSMHMQVHTTTCYQRRLADEMISTTRCCESEVMDKAVVRYCRDGAGQTTISWCRKGDADPTQIAQVLSGGLARCEMLENRAMCIE